MCYVPREAAIEAEKQDQNSFMLLPVLTAAEAAR